MSTDVVGLVPAAGHGTRVSPLPCSNEVFPVGFQAAKDGSPRPKAAAHHLLEKMAGAGASRAIVVLREGKWDIPAYLGHGRRVGLDLAYVVMRRPFGVPYSVDDARAFVGDATVLFGFPDILSRPDDMYGRLLAGLRSSEADVTVAVFPMRPSGQADGIDLDGDGGIPAWERAPGGSHEHTWIAAAWTPAFTEFLHAFLDGEDAVDEAGGVGQDQDIAMGEAIRAAAADGFQVEPVRFDDGAYVDIGTPEILAEAIRNTGIPGRT